MQEFRQADVEELRWAYANDPILKQLQGQIELYQSRCTDHSHRWDNHIKKIVQEIVALQHQRRGLHTKICKKKARIEYLKAQNRDVTYLVVKLRRRMVARRRRIKVALERKALIAARSDFLRKHGALKTGLIEPLEPL